ncbi:MAG TPA: energy transducer TonB [Pyrinomonadaceae bacterium]|nr:energy transducer TonB [Pyrinomonadaceae bacterium]
MRSTLVIALGFLFAFCGVFEAEAQTPSAPASRIREHQILDTPRAPYTFQARENEVQGVVSLQVELKANGTIGVITPLSTLPHGLTEQAIASARRLRFRPKMIDGVPVDVAVTVSYRFSLYYANSDPDIETRAQITSMPRPAIKRSDLPQAANGRVKVELYLGPEGQVYVFQYLTELPADLKRKLDAAVSEVKFKPAVLKNGRRTGVTMVIEYVI